MSSEFGVRSSERSLFRPTFRVSHFAAVLLLAATAVPQFSVPDAKGFPGWKPGGKAGLYTKADLYGYMDGGAELFFEFGFTDLTVQKYGKGADELALEVYRMGDAEGALGMYLIRAGREVQIKGVEARSTGDRYQFSACKGNVLFQVNNFKGDQKRVPDMIRLLNAALGTLAKDWPEPKDPLPKADRIPGTFLILRGPLALSRIVTLGEGDILQMKGKVTAHAADYEEAGKGTFTRILAAYPDEKAAEDAFGHLAGHLDPYLTVTQRTPSRLQWRDAQGKFGEAVLEGSLLFLRTGLTRDPR